MPPHIHGHGHHGHHHGPAAPRGEHAHGDHAHHHHEPGHHHAEHAGPADHGHGSRRALRGALILNGAFLVIEAGVGWWTGSLALLSDAAHMVSDVAGLLLALVAATLATTPETAKRTFGLVRAEILGAFLNGLALVGACFLIFREAYERLSAGPPQVPALPVLVVGAVGLAINLLSALMLWRSDDGHDLNVRGALLHMLADALGSLGAVIASVLMLKFGLSAADAVVSVLIGVLVLYSSWGLLRESTLVLLQFAPPGFERDALAPKLLAIAGVRTVHAIRAWSLGSGHIVVTVHLTIDPTGNHCAILRAAERVLRHDMGAAYTTIQLDPEGEAPCAESHA